jgi:exodeoxyribonuclease V beta subunit
MPGGTAFGTLVHAVLEGTPGDQPERLPDRCAEALGRYRVAGVSADELARVLGLSMTTPLGPLVGGADLTAFGAADTSPELDFEIALDTRTSAAGSPVLADLADLMAAHLPPDDPLAAYPEQLRGIATPAKLRGFLNGSIDAVLRWHSPTGPRYVVVDYKTNWLGPRRDSGIPLTAWHYRPEVLPQAMMDAHYPLQALLYTVALHRHLRFRLGAAYRPEHDLGGVLYLFLRGMVGPHSPPGSGVFSWQPGAELVADASDLLSSVSGAAR